VRFIFVTRPFRGRKALATATQRRRKSRRAPMGENKKTPGSPRSKRPRPKRAAPAAEQAAKPSALAAFLAAHKRAIGYGALAMAATFTVALGALLVVFGRSRPSGTGGVVDVDWPADLGAEASADKLAALGLVDDASAMAVFLRATGGTREFVAGPHLLPTGASPWELRRYLARSMLRPSAKLVVPEGFSRFDIAARLEKLKIASKRGFVAASADPKLLAELGIDKDGPAESAEGYLFPATYDLALDSDPRDVVRALDAAFEKRWAALAQGHEQGLASLRSSLGWGRREVITLASIIEKEAAVDDERPLIASVFLNRLTDPSFHPKRLQSDPTSAYGCVAYPDEAPACKGWSGKPTPAILHDAKNRYSTYTHAGLPPGPISNPGARSIDAVLAPATSKLLYFVATGGGRHTFSDSLGAHTQAVTGPKSP
jgi:UPF0755 protein